MAKLSILLTFCVMTGFAQRSIPPDSLVDVFPLSVGNQWTYGYSYEFDDPSGAEYHCSDTGTVDLRIISRILTADSTRWGVQETKALWQQFNNLPWFELEVQVDTFEIIEFNDGHHRLYRTGDPAAARYSVLPLLSSFPDTAGICRFASVDSAGGRTIWLHGAPMFILNFRQGLGLSSVYMSDGCTCFPSYGTGASLRNSIISGIAPPPGEVLPVRYRLDQNYPNPFNPSTTISFSLPSRSYVALKVFDLMGKEVATVVSEEMQAGNHARQWNASGLAGGVYFYRLQTGSYTGTRKLVILK